MNVAEYIAAVRRQAEYVWVVVVRCGYGSDEFVAPETCLDALAERAADPNVEGLRVHHANTAWWWNRE